MSEMVEMLMPGSPRKGNRRAGTHQSSVGLTIRSVRAGVPIARAERAFKHLDLTLDEASKSVGLKVRTLQRRKAARQKLDQGESEKVFRLARVGDAATEALGNRQAAAHWLRASNAALGGDTPLSLLDTDVGVTAVLDVLTRLEHGVFS